MSPVIAFFATIILTTTVTAQPLIQRIGEPLSHPWGMDFLDDKTLVTERGGQLYQVDLMTGNRTTIGNVPQVPAARQGGLLDVAVWRASAASLPSVYLLQPSSQRR